MNSLSVKIAFVLVAFNGMTACTLPLFGENHKVNHDSNSIAAAVIKPNQKEYVLDFTPLDRTVYEFNLIVENINAMGLNSAGTIKNEEGIKIGANIVQSGKVIARFTEDDRNGRSLSRHYGFYPKPVSVFVWGGMATYEQLKDPIAARERGWTYPSGYPRGGLLRVGVRYRAIVRIEGDLNRFTRVFGESKLAIVERSWR